MKLPATVNVLLLGSGGREHAFASKIALSPRLARLFIAPGNAGTADFGTNIDIQPTNFGSLKQFILANNINLVVVGPEEPLVKGIVDFIKEDDDIHHVPVVGPCSLGARLEGSKEYAKDFMAKYAIPTAAYKTFSKSELKEAFDFLNTFEPPYVLKADGLAADKGVVIPQTIEEARIELESMLGGRFGAAGNIVVIEEFLKGIECSVFVATDGKDYALLPVAKDYKRVGDGDTGPNTGGMGAVSPVPFADEAFMDKVCRKIVEPTIAGLNAEGITYKGFLFIGLMNVGGEPYVIEYNVRMGNPETEVVLPLIESDIIDLFEAIVFSKMTNYRMEISTRTAVTVVCVAGGYPDDYRKGDVVTGFDHVGRDSFVFHAGTVRKGDEVVTNGGRVIAVTSLGDTIEKALEKSYKTISSIEYKGKYYRTDIGKDLMRR